MSLFGFERVYAQPVHVPGGAVGPSMKRLYDSLLFRQWLVASIIGWSVLTAQASSPTQAGQNDVVRTRQQLAEVAAGIVARYADKRLAEYGILDVTRAPYQADPTGQRDCTRVLQQAVKDGRDARLVVFFPAGTYRVSDTIAGIQGHVVPSGKDAERLRNDDFPCILRGSTRGGRAKILLAPNSPGFNDPGNLKPVLYLTARAWKEPHELAANVSFNQMILSLDVEIGPGNPGAIGVDHQAAQGSVVEDVTVRAGDGFAGFRGAPGSGGGMSHITVLGGRYGLYLGEAKYLPRHSGAQPSPVISHLVLTGQTEKAVYYRGRGPLTLAGARIEGAGIQLEGPSWAAWDGGLNVVDASIQHTGDGPAIAGNRPVYLSNVYVQNAAAIARIDGAPVLKGVANGWTHIREYAAGPGPQYSIWMDGARRKEPVVQVAPDAAGPPADLLRPHAWKQPLPTWEDEGVINVRAATYGAKGDGKADDADAIQRALDTGDAVFLPKGIYRLSRPLRLGSRSRLIGLGTYSILSPILDAPAFSDPEHPQPVLTTLNDPTATTTVAFVLIWCRAPGAYAMHWQAGRHSMVRNVLFRRWPWPSGAEPASHPFVLVDGSGGGRWYNVAWGTHFGQAPGYRHFLARGTRQPLSFYMFNPEHASSDYQTEFDDVQNLNIYALKAETIPLGPIARPPVLISSSRNFRIFGYGGNASAERGSCLFRLEACTDFLLSNFGQQHMKTGAAPESWHMLADTPPDGATVRTPATEFFLLYRRGQPSGVDRDLK